MTQSLNSSGWPIVLTAETIVNGTSEAKVNTVALKNPTGSPFEIHEIRVSLRREVTPLNGAAVGMKLVLGNEPLTNTHIPIWNFGRSKSDLVSNTGLYSWRLRHPLYVPSNAVVEPSFMEVSGGASTDPVTVRISYVGRVLPVGYRPKTIFLPWVASWISKAFNYMEAGTDESTELDMINAYPVPVRLDRFTAHTNIFAAGIAPSYGEQLPSPVFRVMVSTSRGDQLVRLPTPLTQVFGFDGHSWELNGQCIMAPNAFYKIQLEKIVPFAGDNADSVRAFFGLVGWREQIVLGAA